MTDRELLELAAKADGEYHGEWSDRAGAFRIRYAGEWREWNPLTNSGDALRLSVKLSLWIGQHDGGVTVSDLYARFKEVIEEDYGTDPYAATRRAIVRAAAAIGRNMK